MNAETKEHSSVSDERLQELIDLTVGRDTKKCLLELQSRRIAADNVWNADLEPTDIASRLNLMKPSERQAFFERLLSETRFCKACFYDTADGPCHCENDE